MLNLEEEVKNGKNTLAKMEAEKRQLQDKLTDLEKVNLRKKELYCSVELIK